MYSLDEAYLPWTRGSLELTCHFTYMCSWFLLIHLTLKGNQPCIFFFPFNDLSSLSKSYLILKNSH